MIGYPSYSVENFARRRALSRRDHGSNLDKKVVISMMKLSASPGRLPIETPLCTNPPDTA